MLHHKTIIGQIYSILLFNKVLNTTTFAFKIQLADIEYIRILTISIERIFIIKMKTFSIPSFLKLDLSLKWFFFFNKIRVYVNFISLLIGKLFDVSVRGSYYFNTENLFELKISEYNLNIQMKKKKNEYRVSKDFYSNDYISNWYIRWITFMFRIRFYSAAKTIIVVFAFRLKPTPLHTNDRKNSPNWNNLYFFFLLKLYYLKISISGTVNPSCNETTDLIVGLIRSTYTF